MRLLHTKTFEVEEFGDNEIPQYAILSHTWGKEEVTLQDIKMNKQMKLEGYEKVKKACSVAATDGFIYIWIDTCCIDKTSSAELSEVLNSMYRWYQEAEECYAYLVDVPQSSVNQLTGVTGPEFRKSRWFTRGWTLQELIAPSTVIFLDNEWQEIGTKSNLQRAISEITGIPGGFLLGDDIENASVAQRMSWASKRETTRIEDRAYCLMGLFGIYMPMLYGEGEKAFIRLQEEILKVSDDHSLFAWRSTEDHGGILAISPAAFADSGNVIPIDPSSAGGSPATISSRGVSLSLPLIDTGQQGIVLAILHCTEIGKERMRLAVRLRDVFITKQDFIREQSSTLDLIHLDDINSSQYPLTSLHVRQWHPKRKRKWEDIEKCVIKLEGVEEQEVALRIVNLDSNCELSDGLMVMNIAAIPDGILSRLLIVCKDGNFFQILLKKYGRALSANISTSTKPDLQIIQDLVIPGKEQNDQDRIVKLLGGGQYVNIAIKKRVLLLREGRCLTGVVQISYSGTLQGAWLEHIAILETAIEGKSLLSYAALRGLETVLQHLLNREGTDPNSKDEHGRMPLSWAAEGGQEAIVKFLLKKGAELESKDKNGRTPLSWAAETGHDAIIWLLLEKATVLEENEKHSGDQKLLSRMAWQRLLPTKGAKLELKGNDNQAGRAWLDSKDFEGRTPLSWAAGNGHEAVVQLLLTVGANANSRDHLHGQTPLSWAARNGHEAVVRLLLATGKVEVDSERRNIRTPAEIEDSAFSGAILVASGGRWRHKINVWTRLSWAARHGHDHEAVVQRLPNTDSRDNMHDQTPLSWASRNGHEAVVRLLLATSANADSRDKVNDLISLS